MAEIKVADLFQIQKRYVRSVHLERDFLDDSALEGYVLTDHARNNFERIAIGLSPSSGQRAWRITGDYGSGKSSFALVLANLFSGKHKRLTSRIQKALDFEKLARFPRPHFFPVLVTGSREPLNIALLRSLFHAIRNADFCNEGKSILNRTHSLLNGGSHIQAISDDMVIELITEMNSFIRSSKKGNGVLIILDELGKFLEFAALHPERQDVYFLQKLAEMAMRSREFPIFVVGLLHQGFNAYADQLSQSAQKEWEKVAGRFEELIFNQPLEQITTLIASALNIRIRQLPTPISSQAESDMESVLNVGWYGVAFNRKQMLGNSRRIYPLHPSVIPVLVKVFSRYGQNERSLFSFLLSNEPFALQDFAGRVIGPNSFYRLFHLYDYIRVAFGHRLGVQSYRSRWNHIDSLIESFQASDETELQILKTVGVLNLLDANNLLASEEAILLAVSGENSKNATRFKSAIRRLQKERKVLYHRGAAGGYCLWSYTSINLEKVYEDASKAVSTAPRICSIIREHLETRPIVARRHYIETGNLRYFEVRHAPIFEFNDALLSNRASSDGLILIPLCENEGERAEALSYINSGIFKDQCDVLLALPKPLGNLSGLVLEAQRWQWISENTPELNTDTYAAEEVSRQIEESRKMLEKRIQSFIGLKQFTAKMELQWFHLGKQMNIANSRELLSALSDICDSVYTKAPKIKNELVNRHSISSAAAAARMRLIERVFQYAATPLLGMNSVKKPPEMSIYLSVFKSGGLHIETDEGYVITEPNEHSDLCHVRPALNRIREVLEMNKESRLRISDIYAELRKEPYGVRDGIIPILIAVFAKTNEQDIAFYENATFMRHIEGADFQRIIKAPETFEIQYCRIAGVRAELFDKLVCLLELKRDTRRKAHILDVVQPLCDFAARLPIYSHNTIKLSPHALAVRSVLLTAQEPAPLLFNDLPIACGFHPFPLNGNIDDKEILNFVTQLKGALDELKGCYLELLDRIKSHMLEKFDLPGTLGDVRGALSKVAENILVAVTEARFKAFCLRIMDNKLFESEWLESLGSFICSKPPSRWQDTDEDTFHYEFALLASRFRRVESICFKGNKLGNKGSAIRIAITKSDGAEIEKVVYISEKEESIAAEMEVEITKVLAKNKRVGMTAFSRAFWKTLS